MSKLDKTVLGAGVWFLTGIPVCALCIAIPAGIMEGAVLEIPAYFIVILVYAALFAGPGALILGALHASYLWSHPTLIRSRTEFIRTGAVSGALLGPLNLIPSLLIFGTIAGM